MNKKNGFTLVELLAVIAILAILVIIALPNVMGMFNQAKESSFMTETKQIYKVAEQKWMNDSMFQTGERVYTRCKTCNGPTLDLSGRTELEYYIKFDQSGKVVEYYVTDGSYQYSYSGNGLLPTDIKEVEQVANLSDGDKIAIENDSHTGASSGGGSLSIGGIMMAGVSSEAYDYYPRTSVYKDRIETITFTNSLGNHTANGTDCWDFSLNEDGTVLAWVTDNDSNGMYEMTIGANGKITVPTCKDLFYEINNLTAIYGMQYFDTTNVTDMEAMFIYCASLRSVDLRYLDTSKVTTMMHMFHGCISMTSIEFGDNFDTSQVTNMSYMFYQDHNLTSIKFNRFDTSKVTTMRYMFKECSGLVSLDLSKFNTSQVRDMSNMFEQCSNLRTIYVSSNFVTTSVTNSTKMFNDCTSLVGGSGTTYNSNQIALSYARVDGGPSRPGYFTLK